MTRLLFLCLLLLLPASADISDTEGSADNPDDEDENTDYVSAVTSGNRLHNRPDSEKATGGDENGDGYLIIIVIAGVVLALSVAAVVTILIVRRKMQQQEQGIYTVPTEQDHKEKV